MKELGTSKTLGTSQRFLTIKKANVSCLYVLLHPIIHIYKYNFNIEPPEIIQVCLYNIAYILFIHKYKYKYNIEIPEIIQVCYNIYIIYPFIHKLAEKGSGCSRAILKHLRSKSIQLFHQLNIWIL